MKKPLEGVLAIDCGLYHAGPGGLAILGDLGAEVIKIEQPVVGEPLRKLKYVGDVLLELPGGRSLFCEGSNRNKKSLTLDLHTQKGQKILYRLVEKADVFMTNMRLKPIEQMNMTWPQLKKVNPRLIYARVSAFGPQGPDKDRGGFDYQGQARSGLMYSMGEEDMTPIVCQFGIIDQATAIMTSHQILTALYMREKTGQGQEVHTSILSSALFLIYFNVLTAQMGGFEIPRHKRSKAHPLRNYYRCSDDRWVMLTLTPPTRFWGSFCRAIGRPDLENDPRYDQEPKRQERAEELVTLLDGIFATRTRDEWLSIFSEYDLFCAGVNTLMDLQKDPQILANGYLVDFEHPTMGRIKIPGYPVHFSDSRAGTASAAPELGEHTEEVLTSIGGYSREEIESFRREGIV
jgi:crotonobetainyl-CoA:carnitine CoA-transferase CaiB-like acyl-CoA transferase